MNCYVTFFIGTHYLALSISRLLLFFFSLVISYFPYFKFATLKTRAILCNTLNECLPKYWKNISLYCLANFREKYYSLVWYILLVFINTFNFLTLFWLAESIQWIFAISARDVITADYTIIMSMTLKVTGNHVKFPLCVASRQSRSKNLTYFFRSMYNKTIIRFGFFDI